jgi:hypothetical protein
LRTFWPVAKARRKDSTLTARQAMVALVEGMDDADLEREGRHPFFGVGKMEQFLKLVYRHNMIHERDVRKALDAVQ